MGCTLSNEEDTFCQHLNQNLSHHTSPEGNKILLSSTFSKLTTSTSCHFKVFYFDINKYTISENKIKDLPISIENLTNLELHNLNKYDWRQVRFDNNDIREINKSLYNWLLEKKADLLYNPGYDNKFGN